MQRYTKNQNHEPVDIKNIFLKGNLNKSDITRSANGQLLQYIYMSCRQMIERGHIKLQMKRNEGRRCCKTMKL